MTPHDQHPEEEEKLNSNHVSVHHSVPGEGKKTPSTTASNQAETQSLKWTTKSPNV